MIVVVGLAFEARIVDGPGLQVICSGDGRHLAARLAMAARKGARGLISFGVAGGLAPDLKPGACVIGSAVLSEGTRITTHPVWAERLLEALPGAAHGAVLGVSAPVACPNAKSDLHHKTGALAVDMESHVVAHAALTFGLPMAAIRVVTDPANRSVPRVALAAMRPDGTTDFSAMLRAIASRPREIPSLVRTALDARAARAALLRGRQLLGPSLGVPDFDQLQLDVA